MSYLKLLVKNVWVKVSVWNIILVTLLAGVAWFYNDLYTSEQDTAPLSLAMENPAMVALIGPMPPGEYTVAAMFTHNMILISALVIGIFNIIIATQVSKREESSGMTELLIASNISHVKIVMSQLWVGIIINLPYLIITFLLLRMIEMNGASAYGDFLFVVSLGLFGMLFFGIALLCAALFERVDTAFGVSIGLLVMMYIYRSVTDVSNPEWSTVSPYNWLTRVYHYSENNVTWLLLFLVVPVIIVIAIVLFLKRDLGSGYIKGSMQTRTRKIGSYLRLLLTQTTRMIIIWIILMFIIGASYGAVFGDVNQLIDNNAMLRMIVSGSEFREPIDFFLGMISIISALIACIPGILIVGRMIKEESDGLLELVDAGSIRQKFNRVKVLLTHLTLAIVVSVVAYVSSLLGMFSTSQNQDSVEISLGQYVDSMLNESSAIILIITFSALLFAISQPFFKIIWLVIGLFFFINYLGEFIQLGDTVKALSPFYHLGNSFVDGANWMFIGIYLVVSILFVILACALYPKRDLVH